MAIANNKRNTMIIMMLENKELLSRENSHGGINNNHSKNDKENIKIKTRKQC